MQISWNRRLEMIEDTIALLMQTDDLDVYGGSVSLNDIANLAEFAGFQLPTDYIYFLQHCGFASWLRHSVYGVFDAMDSRFPKSYNFSAVTQTLKARQMNVQYEPSYFDSTLVIGGVEKRRETGTQHFSRRFLKLPCKVSWPDLWPY